MKKSVFYVVVSSLFGAFQAQGMEASRTHWEQDRVQVRAVIDASTGVRGDTLGALGSLLENGNSLASEDIGYAAQVGKQEMVKCLLELGVPLARTEKEEGGCFDVIEQFTDFLLQANKSLCKDRMPILNILLEQRATVVDPSKKKQANYLFALVRKFHEKASLKIKELPYSDGDENGTQCMKDNIQTVVGAMWKLGKKLKPKPEEPKSAPKEQCYYFEQLEAIRREGVVEILEQLDALYKQFELEGVPNGLSNILRNLGTGLYTNEDERDEKSLEKARKTVEEIKMRERVLEQIKAGMLDPSGMAISGARWGSKGWSPLPLLQLHHVRLSEWAVCKSEQGSRSMLPDLPSVDTLDKATEEAYLVELNRREEENGNGWTPLIYAISLLNKVNAAELDETKAEAYFDIMQKMLAKGVSVETATKKSGNTPLHVAIIGATPSKPSSMFPAEELIKWGADPKVRNREGKTPMDLAAEKPEVRACMERAIEKRDKEKAHEELMRRKVEEYRRLQERRERERRASGRRNATQYGQSLRR